MKKYLKTDEWNIIEDQFHPDRQRMSESIFSLGNGRFGQRGYFEEPYSSDSYRGSFVAAALMAAMPVGASTTCFFFVFAQIYFRKVDLPVPALPVRNTD